jgi:hypothetical protein
MDGRGAVATLVALALVGELAGPAQAEVRTFTNDDGDNAWSNARNWQPQGVPANGDDAVIPQGKTPILAGAGTTIRRVVVLAGASLQVTQGASLVRPRGSARAGPTRPRPRNCPGADWISVAAAARPAR